MAKYVSLLGAPCGLGGRDQETAEGPHALIVAGLLGYLRIRGHAVTYHDLKEWHCRDQRGDPTIWSSTDPPKGSPHHVKQIAAVNDIVAAHVFKAHYLSDLPVVLGGDHSFVIGSITPGLARYGERLGIIWLDAHLDVHTPTTSHSGNANGMPLATIMGYGNPDLLKLVGNHPLKPEHLVHIGAGSLFCESEELNFFQDHNIQSFPMSIVRTKPRSVCKALQKFIDEHDAIHVSFDVDVLHRKVAPGVDYPSQKGMTLSCARHILGLIATSGKLVSADMMEYKPSADRKNRKGEYITAKSIMILLDELLSVKTK